MTTLPLRYDYSRFSEMDNYHFREGTHYRLYDKLGAHIESVDGKAGVYFALWAPNAKYISVIGDFNDWNKTAHPMRYKEDGSGIWECFVEGVSKGAKYKYYLESHIDGYIEEKSDPYSLYWEKPPKSASIVWSFEYEWKDEKWMEDRPKKNHLKSPVSVYEVHLGSWKRSPDDNTALSYREIAQDLADYVFKMGFTHVELLPITEHPYHGSWGYQTIGYFAPTARFGEPEDFMYLVDTLHSRGIGVILDWVPSHFAVDMHGLARFDGSHLYEHSDSRQGFHPEWGSCIFNLGRNEVLAFLISSALFWMDKYHIDGIRVDAVSSMLYLDFARKAGEWIPNIYGGRENLEAIKFLQKLNYNVYANYPGAMMIAEESSDWPMVTKPTYLGGLGFEFKWNMGWMHDSLKYFSKNPVYRKFHHEQITFSMWYAFNEQYMLSLSHDEVVHMKGSLIGKMSGDYWQKFANLRLLFGFMYAHPGKKLLFMGGEFAQFAEWNYDNSLDWHLLGYPMHKKMFDYFKYMQNLYKKTPPLWVKDHDRDGFEWIDVQDSQQSVVSFLRFGESEKEVMLVVCNFTPAVRYDYKIGAPLYCEWEEILNSDYEAFGGSGVKSEGIHSLNEEAHGREFCVSLCLPPLSILWLRPKL